jgi:hypothetical protein
LSASGAIKKSKVPIAPKEVYLPRPAAARLQQRTLTPRSSMTGSITSSSMGQQQQPPMASFEMPSTISLQQLPSATSSSAASDLNAAIEMEVSRRLKARIDQAALSRQALLIMQQQEAKARREQQLRYQLAMLQQQNQYQQQQQQMQQQQQYQAQQQQQYQAQQQQMQQRQLAMSPNVTAGLVRHLAALKFGPSAATYKSNTTSTNYPQAFGSSAMGMPPTNIQGAKTA